MKLSLLCLAASAAAGKSDEKVGRVRGKRWRRKLEWRETKRGMSRLLTRSRNANHGWSPCDVHQSVVSTESPKRKLTKVETCMIDQGADIVALKCLNWKFMNSHPDVVCRQACFDIFAKYDNLQEMQEQCAEEIEQTMGAKQGIQRGGGKKKKSKKRADVPIREAPDPLFEAVKPTMGSNRQLLFDDQFDDNQEGSDALEAPRPIDLDTDRPLFEDLDETGSLILFDDDDIVENYDVRAEFDEIELSEDDQPGPSKGKGKKANKRNKRKNKKGRN